ncbi:MAG TPA: nuclear transport factor 2 family protein [Ktedonobacterales bacterium]|jgi:ketosteroid isomerase-like protein
MDQAPAHEASATPAARDAKTAAILRVLHAFADAYSRRDLDGVMAHFAPGDTPVLFGTGPDERRIGYEQIRAQIQRDFDQSEAITITWGWHTISVTGRLAWVAAEAQIHARIQGHSLEVPLRVTFICEQRKQAWLVVQGHLSSPMPGQAPGHSFPG